MTDMSNLPTQLLTRHEAQLDVLGAGLGTQGHTTRLLGSDEVPLPTLLVAYDPDEQGRERTLGISIMPLDEAAFSATELVQFYVRMPFEVPDERRTDLMTATAVVNAEMAIGHFALRGDELYYRYVLAMPDGETFDPGLVGELVRFIAFHQQHFGDHLEGVLRGEVPPGDGPA